MKNLSKKNLRIDKEVIASLSEGEMQSVVGGSEIVPEPETVTVCPTQLNSDCARSCATIPPIDTERTFCLISTDCVVEDSDVCPYTSPCVSDDCPESYTCQVTATKYC